jgi:GAF domain-containing protein
MGEGASEQRLQFLYELSRGLTAFSDLEGLVRFAAQRTRELFRAQGCALILLDQARNELYFPVVSDADAAAQAKVEQLRFPADRGVAGWVLQNDQAAVIPDVPKHPRFYDVIDQQTSMQTRSMLCAPLRTAGGNIGVIEIVNPAAEFLSDNDARFLETIAGDVAIACERAQLVAKLRGEVSGLRQVFRLAGGALIVAGLLLVAGSAVRHLAWALPLGEMLNAATLLGGGCVVAGLTLVGIARGWLVGRAEA